MVMFDGASVRFSETLIGLPRMRARPVNIEHLLTTNVR
jgi:hypothetical protein